MLRATMTLPPNFVYSLQDIYVSLGGAGLPAASNWELLAELSYLDATAGNNSFAIILPLDSSGAVAHAISGLGWEQPYCLECTYPSFLAKAGSVYSVRMINRTIDDIAITFNIVMSFLVYTVAQEFDAGVNTPLLTR